MVQSKDGAVLTKSFAFEHRFKAVQKCCCGHLFVCTFGFSQEENNCYLLNQSIRKMCNHRTTDEWETLHNGTQFLIIACIRYE